MGNSCGPEAIFVASAGEPAPAPEVIARRCTHLVDNRDLGRAALNVHALLKLVGASVDRWGAAESRDAQTLDWWGPAETRGSYQAVVMRLSDGDEVRLEQVEEDGYASLFVHSLARDARDGWELPRSGRLARGPRPPADYCDPQSARGNRMLVGTVTRVGVVAHCHTQPPPYRRVLTYQFLVEIEATTRLLMAAEGYDVDEWRIHDSCDAARHPTDGRWPDLVAAVERAG